MPTTLIPVIKGKMGDREYYTGVMSFEELATNVQFFSELKQSSELVERLQRDLSSRAKEMTNYLLHQKERFYGAIIIAAWGGHPQFLKVKMEDHPLLNSDYNFGLLKFDGQQEYFALDGQHRLASIKDAIDSKSGKSILRKEEVSVIILTHERNDIGNIRTRRLFHTLNRYAKPTTTGENVALDEDNVIAIATRALVGEYAIFAEERLELSQKNVSPSEKHAEKFTSLAALYEFNGYVLEALYNFEKDYLKFRPDDEKDVPYVSMAISSLWDHLIHQVPALNQVETGLQKPGYFRNNEFPADGNILFRPVGLAIYGKIISGILRSELEGFLEPSKKIDTAIWSKVWKKIKDLPLVLGESPWKGTIFRNNKMEPSAKTLATRLALYMLGDTSIDVDELREEYRGHLEDPQARLPKIL